MYTMIFGAMTSIAVIALLVAALGIANTMLMSVLERTREIGIMKAVGAGNGHLQLMFLVEGAIIGIVGGGLGLLLAWGSSYPADAWVRSMVSRDLKVELNEAIFVFPLWVTLAAPLFAALVTTLAAVYPARRAARVDPVAALRHE
jgi:putative ABC transport system permease protein